LKTILNPSLVLIFHDVLYFVKDKVDSEMTQRSHAQFTTLEVVTSMKKLKRCATMDLKIDCYVLPEVLGDY